MSWDNESTAIRENERYMPFSFFKSDGGDGVISESIAPGKGFRLQEIRLHFSAAFASVEYLVARLSSINGSVHNVVLVSYLCNGSTDIVIYYSEPRTFLSGDQLVVSLSNVSAINSIGLNVIGWAVRG